ncbi:MAG: hypothetical protein JWO36_3144 [Myxococcales bacterium]|nr:hypothetical protein [Myxococcales bacterium]
MSTARALLDQAYSLARVATLEADPAKYAALLASELPAATTLAELEARERALTAALADIEAMIIRIMRLRLDQALAADTSIGPPTRTVFASTIASYARDVSLLEQRARDIALRGRAANPDEVAGLIGAAARSTLALRDALRQSTLALIGDLANRAIAAADHSARDRKLGDAERRKWSATRRDLETIAGDPESILSAPLASRLAALPEQLDEPAPEAEVTFADMIELD